jgi:hypothetical protein
MACGGRYRMDDRRRAATGPVAPLKVCHNVSCVTVTVQDSGQLGPNWLDLSTAAFRQLAPLSEMLITATVEVLAP